MKKDHKKLRHLLWWVLGAGAYLLTLAGLTLAERASPDASIRSMADAFWYSIVTMSTVGYGDLYPVTPVGKLLGIVFVLLSLGLLSFMLSLIVGMITGKILPALKLLPVRHRHWYIFSCCSNASQVLMEDLRRLDSRGVFLFPEKAPPGALCYPGTPEALAARKKQGCSLFFMEDSYERALNALSLGHPVYCLTDYAPDVCPQGLTLFNRYDCCAQEYWRSQGLRGEERDILLLGSGEYASHLLTRGLLMNVVGAQNCRRYHLFGDWTEYRRHHHRLSQVFAIGQDRPDRDSLYFYDTPCTAHPQLLAQASRIILCGDDFSQNLRLLGKLRTFFPLGAEPHLLFDRELPGETVFGTDRKIYTAEGVCGHTQTKAARTMHEIYRRSTGGTAPTWEALSEFLRQSNIAAADHLITKLRLLLQDPTISTITTSLCQAAYCRYQALSPEEKEACRKLEHRRWAVFHSLYNWHYAPQRNNAAREHPLLVDYSALDYAQQIKDDYPWEMLRELAQNL